MCAFSSQWVSAAQCKSTGGCYLYNSGLVFHQMGVTKKIEELGSRKCLPERDCYYEAVLGGEGMKEGGSG